VGGLADRQEERVVSEPASLRVLMALAGLHHVNRGAEAVFESLASELASRPGVTVTVIGSGPPKADARYRYAQVACTPRERFERWPKFPPVRDGYCYEEATFAARLWDQINPDAHDLTVACSYPFVNWALRAKRGQRGRLPHVYITQNGDWPAHRQGIDYRFFGCDGLVCTTPEYFDRQRSRWNSVLIPNGVDIDAHTPGPGARGQLGLPTNRPVVGMVGALTPYKRMLEGLEALAQMPDVFVAVLGDGELRERVEAFGRDRLAGRFSLGTLPRERMPAFYQSLDALLHMSTNEPFGNIYIESMACGVPCIAHEWSSTKWIMPGSPWLVDTKDVARVRDAVSRAIQAKQRDSGLATALHQQAAERFSWKRVADQYEAFFRAIVQAKLPSASHTALPAGGRA
jgi:glycosyltransferase involved in cell wall biosynthesis